MGNPPGEGKKTRAKSLPRFAGVPGPGRPHRALTGGRAAAEMGRGPPTRGGARRGSPNPPRAPKTPRGRKKGANPFSRWEGPDPKGRGPGGTGGYPPLVTNFPRPCPQDPVFFPPGKRRPPFGAEGFPTGKPFRVSPIKGENRKTGKFLKQNTTEGFSAFRGHDDGPTNDQKPHLKPPKGKRGAKGKKRKKGGRDSLFPPFSPFFSLFFLIFASGFPFKIFLPFPRGRGTAPGRQKAPFLSRSEGAAPPWSPKFPNVGGVVLGNSPAPPFFRRAPVGHFFFLWIFGFFPPGIFPQR